MNALGTTPEWGDGYATPPTTQGDLIVRGFAADTRLGIGTAGQVLKVNAGGNSPEWATLGTMSAQNANAVNITGGTISGLTTPLAVASGGTGLNAFGAASQSMLVNKTANALAWHEVDCLDIASLKDGLADGTDLNTIIAPGTYWMQNGASVVNKPATMTLNSIRITVKQINTNNIIQTVETAESNLHFARTYNISGASWSDWIAVGNVFGGGHYVEAYRATNYTIPSTGQIVMPFDTIAYDTDNAFNTATHQYTVPISGFWYFWTHRLFQYFENKNDYQSVNIYVAGQSYQLTQIQTTSNMNYTTVSGSWIGYVAKGAIVYFTAYVASTYTTWPVLMGGRPCNFVGFYLGA